MRSSAAVRGRVHPGTGDGAGLTGLHIRALRVCAAASAANPTRHSLFRVKGSAMKKRILGSSGTKRMSHEAWRAEPGAVNVLRKDGGADPGAMNLPRRGGAKNGLSPAAQESWPCGAPPSRWIGLTSEPCMQRHQWWGEKDPSLEGRPEDIESGLLSPQKLAVEGYKEAAVASEGVQPIEGRVTLGKSQIAGTEHAAQQAPKPVPVFSESGAPGQSSIGRGVGGEPMPAPAGIPGCPPGEGGGAGFDGSGGRTWMGRFFGVGYRRWGRSPEACRPEGPPPPPPALQESQGVPLLPSAPVMV